jgi:hypothetical protein
MLKGSSESSLFYPKGLLSHMVTRASQPSNNAQSTVYEEVHIDLAIDMITNMFDGNDGEP